MRRLIAFLSLCAFANLSFAQVPGSCPLLGTAPQSTDTASDSGSAHERHHLAGTTQSETLDQSPDAGGSHPGCIMAGPCGMTVDIGHVGTSDVDAMHNESVIALSDRVPASLVTAPDIPPPRA